MIFVISIVKDDLLGTILRPYFIKKIDGKDFYKTMQPITEREILKYKELQINWIKEIINLSENFNLKKLNLKFNKNHKKTSFIKHFEKATKQETTYIYKTLDLYNVKITQLIKANKPFIIFKSKKDQFIYQKDIFKYESSYAKVKFDFKKENNLLFYKLNLFVNGIKINIKNSDLTILCDKEPCIVIDNKLVWFKPKTHFNANKLKPFLTKDEIVIPERMQEIYFEKFVKNTISNFEYSIKGFENKIIKSEIKTILNFEKTVANKIISSLIFKYNEKIIPYYWEQQEFVKVIKINQQYALESFTRDRVFEVQKIEELINLGLINKHKYFEFSEEFISKSKFVNFIKPYISKLKNKNFIIENRLFKENINFEKPKIKYDILYKQDWFDLKIIIQFKDFEIPFYQFKNHILNHISEFELPNNSIFMIPIEWFNELNAFAKKTNKTNQTSIHKSNYSILKVNKYILPDEKLNLRIKEFTSIKKISLPKASIAKLRDYQDIGYQWLYRKTNLHFGVCLADDMGLGKTLQVITLLQKYFENKIVSTFKTVHKQLDLFNLEVDNTEITTFKSTLLILPKVLITNWKEEIHKFAPNLTYCIYYGPKRNDVFNQNLHKKNLIITTYGVVRKDIKFLKNKEFSYLILDESQAIKNPNSKIYKAVTQLQSEYKLTITGTPIENNLTDIWSQMTFLNPNILGNLNYFKNAFAETIKNNSNAPEIKDLQTIIKPFILRRLKKDVAKELPDKITQTIYCQMNDEQQKQYDKEKYAVRNALLFKKEKNMVNILSVLNRLRQFVLHPKLVDATSVLSSGKFEQIKSVMDTLISQGNKFLIFSSFVKHLELYKIYFEENNIAYSMLTGKSNKPQEIVKKYQESQVIKPFLISIKAGGVGLNITSANYVLIIDPWWNPFTEEQAIDRTHRIGQTKNVFIYKFITKNSIEEKILNLQNSKKQMSDSLVNTNMRYNVNDVIDLLQ